MTKLILIAVGVLVIFWLLRRALAGRRKDGEPAQAPGEPKGDLVSCAHCRMNLPKAEARSAGGRHYCSEEHWRAGPRDG
jgi:uncharacterized protein